MELRSAGSQNMAQVSNTKAYAETKEKNDML